jgi:hypothetical protein
MRIPVDRSRYGETGRPSLALIGLAVIVSWLVAGGPAHAHVPALEGGGATGEGTPIAGPDVSRAIYGYLAPDEKRDVYTFSLSQPLTATIGIIVPAYPEHADFRPAIVVEVEGEAPVTIADPGLAERAKEWEPFSLTYFWKGGEEGVGFKRGRRYRLRVEPGDGATSGRYVIVFGGAERFTGSDTLATLRDLPAIWVGGYGGAPLRWNWLALLPAGLVGFAAVGVGLLVRRGIVASRRG